MQRHFEQTRHCSGTLQSGPAGFQRLTAGLFLFALALAGDWKAGGAEATNVAPRPDRGFSYFRDEVRAVPWSVHVVKVHLGHTNLELQTTLGGGSVLGMGLVSQQVAGFPPTQGRPVAAINGDFYYSNANYPGDPMGVQISRGELVSAPAATRVCSWINAAGQPCRTNVLPHFTATWTNGASVPLGLNEDRAAAAAVLYTAAVGPSTRTSGGVELVLERQGDGPWLPLQVGETYAARVREVRAAGNTPLSPGVMVLSLGPGLAGKVPAPATGAVLRVSTATVPDMKGARMAIGGGPTLVRGGKAAPQSDAQGRHPRTAIGWNKDHYFLVEVDGRQRGLSLGMTLSELAGYMLKLGCTEAMNLDGGGSATMWVLGNVMNSPSDGRERPAANALAVVEKSKLQK